MRKLTGQRTHSRRNVPVPVRGSGVAPAPLHKKPHRARARSCLRPRPVRPHTGRLLVSASRAIRKLVRLAEELTTRSARISAASAVTPAVPVPPPWGLNTQCALVNHYVNDVNTSKSEKLLHSSKSPDFQTVHSRSVRRLTSSSSTGFECAPGLQGRTEGTCCIDVLYGSCASRLKSDLKSRHGQPPCERMRVSRARWAPVGKSSSPV